MANDFYIYMIECGDGSLYTGYTTDVKARFQKHEAGKGAKYTRGRGPLTLKYVESFATKQLAMQREWEIKKLSKLEKLKLIDEKAGGWNANAKEL